MNLTGDRPSESPDVEEVDGHYIGLFLYVAPSPLTGPDLTIAQLVH